MLGSRLKAESNICSQVLCCNHFKDFLWFGKIAASLISTCVTQPTILGEELKVPTMLQDSRYTLLTDFRTSFSYYGGLGFILLGGV